MLPTAGFPMMMHPRHTTYYVRADTSAMLLAFASGTIFGTALMYLLDPEMGRRRRALARDQVVHAQHEFGDLGGEARGRATDLRNRAQGTIAETRRAMAGLRDGHG